MLNNSGLGIAASPNIGHMLVTSGVPNQTFELFEFNTPNKVHSKPFKLIQNVALNQNHGPTFMAHNQHHQDTDLFILKDGNFSHLSNYRDNKGVLSDEKIRQGGGLPIQHHQRNNDNNHDGASLNLLSSGALSSDIQKTQYKTFSLTNKQEMKETADSLLIGVAGQSNLASNLITTGLPQTAHQTFYQYSKKFVKDRKMTDNLSRKLGFLTSSINGIMGGGTCTTNTHDLDGNQQQLNNINNLIDFNQAKNNVKRDGRRQTKSKPQREQREEIMNYFSSYKSKFIHKNGVNFTNSKNVTPILLQSRPNSQKRDQFPGSSTTVDNYNMVNNHQQFNNNNKQQDYYGQINADAPLQFENNKYISNKNLQSQNNNNLASNTTNNQLEGIYQQSINFATSQQQYKKAKQTEINKKQYSFDEFQNQASEKQEIFRESEKEEGIFILINEGGNFSHRESIGQDIYKNLGSQKGIKSQKSLQNLGQVETQFKSDHILPQISGNQDPYATQNLINQGNIFLDPTDQFMINEKKLVQMTNYAQMTHSTILEPKHQQIQNTSHNVFKKLIGNMPIAASSTSQNQPRREVVSQSFKKSKDPDPVQVFKDEQKSQIRQRQQSSNPRASSKYFNVQKKNSINQSKYENRSGKKDDGSNSGGSYRKRRSSVKKEDFSTQKITKNSMLGASQNSFIVPDPIQKFSNLSSSNWYIVPQPNPKDKNLQVLPLPKKGSSSNEVTKKRSDYVSSQQFRNISKTSSQSFYNKTSTQQQLNKSPQHQAMMANTSNNAKQAENIKDLECFLEVQKMALLKQSPNIIYNKLRPENYSVSENYKSSVSPETSMIGAIAPNYNKYYAHDYDLNQIIQKQIIRGDIQITHRQLKFCVIPGNNSGLIRDAMLRRSAMWRETNQNDQSYNFKWQPVSYGIRFDHIGQFSVLNYMSQKQLVNHLEFHSQLSEKSKLFINMCKFAMKLKENVFDYIPITFYIEVDSMNLKQFNMQLTQFNSFYYTLEDNKKKALKFEQKYQKYQKKQEQIESQAALSEYSPKSNMYAVDQLITSIFGTNRKSSNKNLVKESQATITFDINNKKSNQKYMMPISHFTGHNLWLLKPTKLNRGRGIHVCNNIGTLKDLMHKYCEGFKKKSITIGNGGNGGGSNTAVDKFVQIATAQKSTKPSSPNKVLNEAELEEQKQNNVLSAHTLTPMNNQDLQDLDQAKSHGQSGIQVPQHECKQTPNQSAKYNSNVSMAAKQVKIKHNSFIIQKYIEKPLLIFERKFDVRVWVFVNYDGCVYLFKEGYLRTSSSKFNIDPNNPDDQFVHLTNNAIQKYSDSYGTFEDGNQMSYDQFQNYLDQYVFDNDDERIKVKEEIVFKFKQLILRSIFATRKQLDPSHRKSCFELFGYDFIMDEDFNVWLIEVNTNPCIEESSSILKIYLPRMIDDMMKLSVDQHFKDTFLHRDPIPVNAPYSFPVKGYQDNENMWDLLVNLRDRQSRKEVSKVFLKPIELRSKFGFQIKNRKLKVRRYNTKFQSGLAGQGVSINGKQLDYEKLLVQSNII